MATGVRNQAYYVAGTVYKGAWRCSAKSKDPDLFLLFHSLCKDAFQLNICDLLREKKIRNGERAFQIK
jgi:hypothetical protein